MNWIVIVPDKPGMLEKRLEVRGQHMEGIKPLKESGRVKMGGELSPSPPLTLLPLHTPSLPLTHIITSPSFPAYCHSRQTIGNESETEQ